MAIKWISSVNGSDGNDGSTKALAVASTTALTAVLLAGDEANYDSAHLEGQGSSLSWTFLGTKDNPNILRSINWTTEAFETMDVGGGVINNTGSSTITGSFVTDGINFSNGSAITLGGISTISLNNGNWNGVGSGSVFAVGNAGGGNDIFLGADFDVNFSNGGNGFQLNFSTNFVWEGGELFYTGAQSTNLFSPGARDSNITFNDVNLSAFDNTVFNLSNTSGSTRVLIHGTELSATSILHGTIGSRTTRLLSIGSDDATGNDATIGQIGGYNGALVTDKVVYMVNGASDGVNPSSWKVDTNANAKNYFYSLRLFEIEQVLTTTGTKTFTIPFVHDSAVNLQDDNIVMVLEYLNGTGTVRRTKATTKPANSLVTPSDLPASTETWVGTGGFANENKQELSLTVTVNRVGTYKVNIYVYMPSKTLYVSPKVVVT